MIDFGKCLNLSFLLLGKWYLKMGHGRAYEETRASMDEVTQWYQQQSGMPKCVQELTQYLTYLLPGQNYLLLTTKFFLNFRIP